MPELPRRPPIWPMLVLLACGLVLVLGPDKLAPFVLAVEAFVIGIVTGRWIEIRARSSESIRLAIHGAESFIASAHRRLDEDDDLDVDERARLETMLAHAHDGLAFLDTIAPRSLKRERRRAGKRADG